MMKALNVRKTDLDTLVECQAHTASVDSHLSRATEVCKVLQARGFSIWSVNVGNVCPIILLRWTPALDELVERGEAAWRRLQSAGNKRVYTYVWPFMDCRVEWIMQGELH